MSNKKNNSESIYPCAIQPVIIVYRHDDGTKKERCPDCMSLKNKGEGKGMFPVCKGWFVCSDCDRLFDTHASYYLRRYREATGEYWDNGK